MRRFLKSWLLVLAATLLLCNIAYGYLWLGGFPAEITVVLPSPPPGDTKSLSLYSDELCFNPIVKVFFTSSANPGTNWPVDVYLKNTGTLPLSVMARSTTNITVWGSLDGSPSPLAIPVGAVQKMTITVRVSVNATAGTFPFNVEVYEP